MIKTIYLAGGCFWGVQHYFDQFDGIVKTTVGYANGNTENPVYKDVKKGLTGHAETLEIQYDDTVISLPKILDLYFDIIDPVSVNQQGEDIGISYRTGIYYLEKIDKMVYFHTKKGEFHQRINMSQLETLFSPYGFLRVHVSFLVNEKHISSWYKDEVELTTGKRIPLSRQQKRKISANKK